MALMVPPDISAIYHNHPLQEGAILDRVLKQRGRLEDITELELSWDEETEITDQNHVGGASFVEELAREACVDRESRILDLGCGLGGAARVLAYRFGCKVHGIDLSEKRIKEARDLTQLVKLDHLVTFSHGDIQKIRYERKDFDIILGQGSWIHISDKRRLVKRCSQVLQPSGTVVLEDSYMKLLPKTRAEKSDVRSLSKVWKAYFVSLEGWRDAVTAGTGYIETEEDKSEHFVEYFSKLVEISQRMGRGYFPELEVKGWEWAKNLGEIGILGYVRIIGRKTGGSG